MINDFNFIQPGSVAEALEVLSANDGVQALAGGTNVMVNMKRAPLETECLVDLGKLDELKSISEEDGCIRLGAGVTFSELLDWKPGGVIEGLMQPMCRAFAGPLIRNLATVGGNVCDASAAADLSPVLLALNASVELQSMSQGTRILELGEFVQGVRKTALRKDELLTTITFTRPGDDESCFYYKLGKRKADAISIVSLAMTVKLTKDNVSSSRIALGAVAPMAIRALTAEKTLEGASLNDDTISAAAEAAVSDSSPIDDFRATGDYRRQMVEVLVKKGLNAIKEA
jgi:CO/xanthine dehydrogenase FAD-binding subunit